MKRHIIIGWLGLAVLLILHFDFWRPRSAALYGGFLPAELGYRVAWMILAWLYLIYVCRRVWHTPREVDMHDMHDMRDMHDMPELEDKE